MTEEIVEKSFEQDLAEVINRHSRESNSNTPDFILATYMNNCLKAFNTASNAREKWYNKFLTPAGPN
jgi:hypothetical protein